MITSIPTGAMERLARSLRENGVPASEPSGGQKEGTLRVDDLVLRVSKYGRVDVYDPREGTPNERIPILSQSVTFGAGWVSRLVEAITPSIRTLARGTSVPERAVRTEPKPDVRRSRPPEGSHLSVEGLPPLYFKAWRESIFRAIDAADVLGINIDLSPFAVTAKAKPKHIREYKGRRIYCNVGRKEILEWLSSLPWLTCVLGA